MGSSLFSGTRVQGPRIRGLTCLYCMFIRCGKLTLGLWGVDVSLEPKSRPRYPSSSPINKPGTRA